MLKETASVAVMTAEPPKPPAMFDNCSQTTFGDAIVATQIDCATQMTPPAKEAVLTIATEIIEVIDE